MALTFERNEALFKVADRFRKLLEAADAVQRAMGDIARHATRGNGILQDAGRDAYKSLDRVELDNDLIAQATAKITTALGVMRAQREAYQELTDILMRLSVLTNVEIAQIEQREAARLGQSLTLDGPRKGDR